MDSSERDEKQTFDELKAAFKQEQTEAEQINGLQKSAAAVKGIYDSLVSVGFTEAQALQITMYEIGILMAGGGKKP